MSDLDKQEWELGMELPSRKETHSKKKRKKEKPAVEEKVPPAAAVSQPVVEAVPVVPAAEPLEDLEVVESKQVEVDGSKQVEVVESKQVEVDGSKQVEVDGSKQVEVDGSKQFEVVESRQVEVVESEQAEEVAEQEESEESEARPFLTTWQWWLLMTLTPILILVVLAYGKLAYIHDVPDHVRTQVDAYEEGPAFLVVKPWWFGPPVFSLQDYQVPEDDYAHTADEHFRRYKIELGHFSGIVEDPWVLYRFPKDYLK